MVDWEQRWQDRKPEGQPPSSSSPNKAPGFYPAPGEVRTQRYWNGSQWVGDPHPLAPVVDTWLITRGVALGSLAAVVLLALLAQAGFFG